MGKVDCALMIRVNWANFLKIIGCLVMLMAVVCLTVLTTRQNDWVDIPKISIQLNGVSLNTINENDKNVIYSDNKLLLESGEKLIEYDDVEIRGRGNYTWTDDKKPYQIGFSKKVNLMGMGDSKKWNLITNNLDDSLMRNDLAQYLAKLVGEEYVFDGKFVNLIIDDEDLGLYYLTKKISIGKDVVNLADEHGVLVELDNNYCEYEENKILTGSGDCLVFKDFVNKDLSEEAVEIFTRKYNDFEELVLKGEYEMMDEVVDMESLAMYYLVGEFVANPDAYLSSFYFYMDGEKDVIHVGPVWDFDGAFGNLNWGNGELEDYAYNPWSDEYRIRQLYGLNLHIEEEDAKKVKSDDRVSKVIGILAKTPEFMERISRIYEDKLSEKRSEVLEYIDKMSLQIKEAAIADAGKWGKSDYNEAVRYLKWWVEQRFYFFDMKFGIGGKQELEVRKI